MGRREYPGAEQWVPRRPTLRSLRAAVDDCRGCDLYRDATQAVMGDGPAGARLMLVGEQPGDLEDLAGLPFVGPAGRLLDQLLVEAAIEPGDVYRTNAVKHFRHVVRPTSTGRVHKRIHRTPVRWQVAACEPWLLAELGVVRPSVVVLLGATAGQAVYGPSFRVGESRGRPLPWPDGYASLVTPPVAVATAHPSSVLRSRQREVDRRELVRDLIVARELLDHPVPQGDSR